MTCLAAIQFCICILDDHDGPHRCACGGSWSEKDGEFVVERFPGEFGERYGGDVAAAVAGILGRDEGSDE